MELVDSVDELRSSSSTRGISMPNFETLDAKIASALIKIIHNSHLKRRISLEEQTDCLLDGSLGPMMLSKTTPTCSLSVFEMTIFRNSILSGTEFYCP